MSAWEPTDDVETPKPLTAQQKHVVARSLYHAKRDTRRYMSAVRLATRKLERYEDQLRRAQDQLASTIEVVGLKRARDEETDTASAANTTSSSAAETAGRRNFPPRRATTRGSAAFGLMQGLLKAASKQNESVNDVQRKRQEIERKQRMEQSQNDVDMLNVRTKDARAVLAFSNKEHRASTAKLEKLRTSADFVFFREDEYCDAFFLRASCDGLPDIPFSPAEHTEFSKQALLEQLLPHVAEYQERRSQVDEVLQECLKDDEVRQAERDRRRQELVQQRREGRRYQQLQHEHDDGNNNNHHDGGRHHNHSSAYRGRENLNDEEEVVVVEDG